MTERRFRIAAGAAAAVFAVSAGVQWNDPDPLAWIGLYGLAAGLSAAAAAGRLPLAPNLGAAGLFAVLFALWAPGLFDARSEAFTSFEMRAARDEAPREAAGLAVCGGWLTLQAVRAWRKRR